MLKYRQGDVGLELVTELPEGLEFKSARTAVLAEGEVTGHYHIMDAQVGGKTDGTEFPLEIAEKDGTMYLRVSEPLPLKHQEHATITVEPGIYKRTIQREYFPDAPRQVLD